MIPVILSGGSGTRLWPLSRGQYPKQFLPLVSDNTMLQETVLRLDGISGLKPLIAVCNEDHRFMLAEQLREINSAVGTIILEPMGKNTAPAVALAALAAQSPDDVLLVLPADHVIGDKTAFHGAVTEANRLAEHGFMVTFGIVPTAPETGYGYIKRGANAHGLAFDVGAFVEKPDMDTAQAYISSGDYYWNSGMFAFKAGIFLSELERFNPQMLAVCREALQSAKTDLDFTRLDKAIFNTCPSDSIDYAVMEKTDKAVVIPLAADWNDVGSWSALWEVRAKDENGNATKGDVLAIETQNSFIHSANKLVATVGVCDLVIVETDDAVMVAPKDRVQEVKQLVDLLKQQKRSEATFHRKFTGPGGITIRSITASATRPNVLW